MFKLCFYCELVSFLGSQFMQDTPLQPKQIVVKTTPYCLHVPFFPAQSILHPYLTIFNSSGGATCLVILIGIIPCFVRCQPLLKWVHKLQFLRSVESVWTFSHDINVHEAYQEFSPSCHLAEEVEFSLQLAICLFCLMLKVLNRFRNSWFFQDFCNTVRHIPECNLDVISPPQKVCATRFECVSSSLSNCLDFLISTAIFLELECKCTGVVKWQIEVPKKNN